MEPGSTFLGFKASTVVPAVAGGVTAGVVMQGPWWSRVAAGVSGALASIFLTDIVMIAERHAAGAVGISSLTADPAFAAAAERATAFCIGLVGMVICQAALAAVQRVKSRAPDLVDRGL